MNTRRMRITGGVAALATAGLWMPGARAQIGGPSAAPPSGVPLTGWRCPMRAGAGWNCPMAGAGGPTGPGLGIAARLSLTSEQQNRFLALREQHRAQMQALWTSNLPADQILQRAQALRRANQQEMVRQLKLTPAQAQALAAWQASRPGPGGGMGPGMGMGPGTGRGWGRGASMGRGRGWGPGTGVMRRMTLKAMPDRVAAVPALADKRAAITAILGPAAQSEARLLQALKDPSANGVQIRDQIRSLHRDAMSQIAAILTPSERTAWQTAMRSMVPMPDR